MNETAFTEFIYWAGMIGVSVFAITGVLAAAGKRIDFFGVVVLGAVTALGGGTMRDVTLNIHPVTWISTFTASYAALVGFYGFSGVLNSGDGARAARRGT